MRVLLSDGSGLTSLQTATILAAKGHDVEVLAPDPLCLTRFTRHVRRVHRVPAFGRDPLGWLDAVLSLLALRSFDVLLPTQEQVTILAREAARVRAAGPALPVPSFAALARVQDKVSAAATLADLGLAQPAWSLAANRSDLQAVDDLPVFVKTPIGTAGSGVTRVEDQVDLAAASAHLDAAGAFRDGPVLVQRAAAGPLAMLQSVFRRGELVAFHANLRVRAGSNNGAALKESIAVPAARAAIERLGQGLKWHGALSADAILTPAGSLLIDINPRLVEPANALRAGTDLVGPLLQVARDEPVARADDGQGGVRTHQTLLAVLGAAQRGEGRFGALRELAAAALRRGAYRGSREELTPLDHDLRAAIPVALVAIAVAIRPAAWRWFAGGAVDRYALTPLAWRQILELAPPRPPGELG